TSRRNDRDDQAVSVTPGNSGGTVGKASFRRVTLSGTGGPSVACLQPHGKRAALRGAPGALG
ncbi:MAG: hypothetical protein KDI64_04710, partial [Candidatus Accumulibacter sp.]|nr:hypothetical protein [Accumulibacter sp.]